jgi:hypothetical protein
VSAAPERSGAADTQHHQHGASSGDTERPTRLRSAQRRPFPIGASRDERPSTGGMGLPGWAIQGAGCEVRWDTGSSGRQRGRTLVSP